MHVRTTRFRGRSAWELDSDVLRVVVLEGGGHIASVTLKAGPSLNPLWEPVWEGMEPWDFRPQDSRRLGTRLLAAIGGHNLCLGWFGDPSDHEKAAGAECHGEASVLHWKLKGSRTARGEAGLTTECDLPVAQMRFTRTISVRENSCVVRFRETVESLSRRDLPFTMCEHVTLGPPFLDSEHTVFDMPATRCHTFPGTFSNAQRLKSNRTFVWPKGPGENGHAVDLRRMGTGREATSDFSAQLIDPKRELGWFSALNQELGLALVYVWTRCDFPWVGNWEEKFARKQKPWAGRSFARGMEFSNTPFPQPLRKAVDLGTFQGQPAYRWLPALTQVVIDYAMILSPAPSGVAGVAEVRSEKQGHFAVDWLR